MAKDYMNQSIKNILVITYKIENKGMEYMKIYLLKVNIKDSLKMINMKEKGS